MRRENKPTAVIDTNLLVSALIRHGTPYGVLQAWRRNDFLLVTSQRLIDEVHAVLSREKISQKYHLRPMEIETFIKELRLSRLLIQATSLQTLPLSSRDPKDNILLSCALTGACDYLVSGDADLLDLNGNPGLADLRIVTATQFLAAIHSRG